MTRNSSHLKIAKSRILEVSTLISDFESQCLNQISAVASLMTEAFRNGSKVLICGNGGSAADSQHFAAELVSAFSKDINRPALPALALTVDTSILTAFSNDFGFNGVFARQVEAFGLPGDILIVLTTSGQSENCIQAVAAARKGSLKTIAFTRAGGSISDLVDFSILVPSTNTQHIQECHMISYHIISEIIELELFGGEN